MVREGRVLISVATDPDFGSGYSVTACKVGAQVSAIYDGTGIPVRAGHGFAALDKFIVGTDKTLYRAVTSVTATKIFCSTVSVASGDLLVNLGQDTGGTEPNYLTPGTSIYTDMDYSNLATNSTVQADAYGRYRYYHKGIERWELVRTGTTPIAVYQDSGASSVTSADSTTDNAVARWDGATGEAIQNSVVTISDTGAVTGVTTLNASGTSTLAAVNASGLVAAAAAVTVGTTLGVTGTSTLAAVNASGLVAAAAAVTVGTTLEVTGATTLTGGVASGTPYNVGIWSPPTSTPGTYKQPVTTEMYVGSVRLQANATITGIKYLIGTAVPAAQNVIVALYNSAGTRVAISVTGGTTMTGSASVTQSIAFTGTYSAVGPGTYFIGLMFDTATAALFAAVPLGVDSGSGVVGVAVTGLTAVTPPSSITAPTTFPASAVIPVASLY